jgi:hypothetical protein
MEVVSIAGMSAKTSYQQVVNIAGMILIQHPLSGQYRRNTRLAFAVVSIAGTVVNMVGMGGHDGQDYTLPFPPCAINRKCSKTISHLLL